jgi:hypothetical protein
MRLSFTTLQVIAEECQDYGIALAALDEPHFFYGIWAHQGRIMCAGSRRRMKQGKPVRQFFSWEEI